MNDSLIAAPKEEAIKMIAMIRSAGLRPSLSAIFPPTSAPMIQPITILETAHPVSVGVSW
ncbi:hypothetical protein RB531_731 [Salmonella enterica subsp. enterica serovar Typhimurium]